MAAANLLELVPEFVHEQYQYEFRLTLTIYRESEILKNHHNYEHFVEYQEFSYLFQLYLNWM